MSDQEKQEILSLISSILILGGYALYVYQTYVAGNLDIINDLRFWGKAFLVLIPVSIVAHIIIHIVFAIINKIVTHEDISTLTDERDKLIELKAIRISHWTFILGFLLSMGSQALGMPPYVMFLLLMASGFVSSIASSLATIYFYRKGC